MNKPDTSNNPFSDLPFGQGDFPLVLHSHNDVESVDSLNGIKVSKFPLQPRPFPKYREVSGAFNSSNFIRPSPSMYRELNDVFQGLDMEEDNQCTAVPKKGSFFKSISQDIDDVCPLTPNGCDGSPPPMTPPRLNLKSRPRLIRARTTTDTSQFKNKAEALPAFPLLGSFQSQTKTSNFAPFQKHPL